MSTFRRPRWTRTARRLSAHALACTTLAVQTWLFAQAEPAPDPGKLDAVFRAEIQPLVARLCFKCHSGDRTEADIDFSPFAALADVRKHTPVWQKVAEMVESGQMPPRQASQPTSDERRKLAAWLHEFLSHEARALAGDPGPVVLRRLNNAEYTFTIRDLTGIESLDPAREFPVDGAAGEGFTNTGNALVMSPSLVSKYLEAARAVSGHLVLLPDGVRFSPHSTRRDWTNELLAEIRTFYSQFTSAGGGERVNLQGIVFDTNGGGRLPLERYLEATLGEREALAGGSKTPAGVARERGLSPKYLERVWDALRHDAARPPSLLLDELRLRWQTSTTEGMAALVAHVAGWQKALWEFESVGHIGRAGGPRAWMQAVDPMLSRQEVRSKLPPAGNAPEVVVHLWTGDAGDGSGGDFAVWERPRLVAPGRPEILLRDVRAITRELSVRRQRLFSSTARCLAAATEAGSAAGAADIGSLASRHGVDEDSLAAWLEHLGIGAGCEVDLGTPISRRAESSAGYDFIKGWVGDDALSVVANSSAQHVRIPGNMKPHSVAVHPAPKLAVVVAWRSASPASLSVRGVVQHAHPECGNGVAWSLELRRGKTRQRLAQGTSHGPAEVVAGPITSLAVLAGDVVALVIAPRNGDHSCDLTSVDVILGDGTREWSLAHDVSPSILDGNPHADGLGNPAAWHFTWEPAGGPAGSVIPAGSLLARWQSAANAAEKQALGEALEKLLTGATTAAPDSPDAALRRQLGAFGGPALVSALKAVAEGRAGASDGEAAAVGLDPARFGKLPDGSPLDAASLCVQAPAVVEVRLPAELAAEAELVAAGMLHAGTGGEGSVQMRVLAGKPDGEGITPAAAVIVHDGSEARKRTAAAFEAFRQLFPPALCYAQIVPVDEAVTLTLYHREDDHLKRLMLDGEQTARLDRLWDNLQYVSREPLELVTAFEQIAEFATQDRPDLVVAFKPLRQPILDRAAAFQKRLIDTQPRHVEALLALAARAYRRPLEDAEAAQLRDLHTRLLAQELPHEEAVRLVLHRILISPSFLYRLEKPAPGAGQGRIDDWELATRLSYFLWSSMPDGELRSVAAAGRLQDNDTLAAQARRMLRHPGVRRLAIEMGCQWLHIHGFDQLDEKSERHFPTFAGLRGAMYEESIQLFTDLFREDRSPLRLLDADYTFLNEALAAHYGIPGVTGPELRRVDGVRHYGRGGVLALSSTLAKHSGASRTSPILRGNWLSEVVLGEKLPKPPRDVPQLPESAPEGLTERQLIEKHSSDPACSKCHSRIDPFGFALEEFDAIGRRRDRDAAGLAIDARTTLPDGTQIDGAGGLRDYVLSARRGAFLRQFHRKLLGYALGRAVRLSDEPLLAALCDAAEGAGASAGDAVVRIVLSPQFREIRGAEAASDE